MSHDSVNDVDARLLSEAAAWFARLQSDSVTASDRDGWSQWRTADPAHERAWRRVEAVRSKLAGLPTATAANVLLTARSTRRNVLRSLGVATVAGSALAAGYRTWSTQAQRAELFTRVGERRDVLLDDGSRVQLDTDSGVDVHYDSNGRRLLLRAGAMLVTTAADAADRPFVVETRHGSVRAFGTRFVVRLQEDASRLAVLEHSVEVRPLSGVETRRVDAGQHVDFDARGVRREGDVTPSMSSWSEGSLIALDMPLGEVVAELARYRGGSLRCDESVAQLSVSGAFPLDDVDRALAALERGFPLRIRRRTDYWVTVLPA